MLGIAAIIYAVLASRYYNWSGHPHPAYLGYGIVSGLLFMTVGIISILASKRQTTCFIVCLMALSTMALLGGVAQTGIGIYGIICTPFYWKYNEYNNRYQSPDYFQYNEYGYREVRTTMAPTTTTKSYSLSPFPGVTILHALL
uniref:Uncharacterized protein n=1 Tax=Ciona savignyi TaxID=51511 RepID=H2Z2W0_CIOSA